MASLTQILVDAQNPNQAIQKQAEQAIQQAETNNFPEFIKALAAELADKTKPPIALRMAGLILKNFFEDTRSTTNLARKTQVWLALPDDVKTSVRNCVLSALASPVPEARKSAAQVTAALGVIEIHANSWRGLIPALLNYATSASVGDDVKINTLEAIGFLCENLDPQAVSEQETNNLLTAIIECMREEKVDELRLAATIALNNTLNFAKANMYRKVERNMIVLRICEATQTRSPELRRAAFECMCNIADKFYDTMPEYIDTFYNLTSRAVTSDEERVGLQAIEFWAKVCEVETDIEQGAFPPSVQSAHYVQRAMVQLVELITSHCLRKQPEDADDDSWNISMAGGTLLGLMALLLEDQILPAIMPFIQTNIAAEGPQGWRSREAGLIAFGKILDGPSQTVLAGLIREGVPHFLGLLNPNKETSPRVRDTASWVIGNICTLNMDIVRDQLLAIIQQVLLGLNDIPVVAARNAWVLQCIGHALEDTNDLPSNIISKCLVDILPRLVQATERPEWDSSDLRHQCFEAINCMVSASAQDAMPIIADLLTVILTKLAQSLGAKIETGQQKEEVDSMIMCCCGTLHIITQRLGERIAPRANQVMELAIHVLGSHNSAAQADAFLVVGAIASAIGVHFNAYLWEMAPPLMAALKNYDEYEICQVAAELVSFIAEAVGESFLPLSSDIVVQLLTNLANSDLNSEVKPPSIVALGDIALAIGDRFEVFADSIIIVLDDAGQSLRVPPDADEDLIDLVNKLRGAILEAYSGIVNGLSKPIAYNVFIKKNRIESVLRFLTSIVYHMSMSDSHISDQVLKSSAGLLGDVQRQVGPDSRLQQAIPFLQVIFERCLESPDERVQQTGTWAKAMFGLT